MGALVLLLPTLLPYISVFIAAFHHIKQNTGQTTDELKTEFYAGLATDDKKIVDELIRIGAI